MPSTREIRRRIRSVKSTAQITRAMEMVSAVKMRRAQAAVLASRPYAERMERLLAILAAQQTAYVEHPLLLRRPVEKTGIILITSDRGFCGALHVNATRLAATLTLEAPGPVSVLTIGRKARDWMIRHGQDVIADVSNLGDRPTLLDTSPISRVVIDAYTEKRLDEVYLVYNEFVSTAVQRPVARRLLPVEPSQDGRRLVGGPIYEPNEQAVLNELLPRFVEAQVYQAVLEATASDHSARMVAMHNATQNANDVIASLTLAYNKARQAGITGEIIEISSGAEALQRG